MRVGDVVAGANFVGRITTATAHTLWVDLDDGRCVRVPTIHAHHLELVQACDAAVIEDRGVVFLAEAA